MPETATKQLVDSFGRTLAERQLDYELMERANAEAAEHWDDPQWRADFAADLTESILLGFEFETLIDRFIDTERVGYNDRIFIKETRGLKAFWMARGGYIEASELTAEVSELPRDMIGVHVYEFEDKFLTNFATSARDLRNLAIRRMDAEVNRRVLTLAQEAIDNASPYYVATPGVSKAAVDAGIRGVRDRTKTGQVAIVGRPTMTDQIADFEGFGNETREEIQRRGVLGRYKGATIISLRNFEDEDEEAFWPANEMWILGTDFGKVGFFGGLKSKEFTEQDNWYFHYLSRRDSGALVHRPDRARRVIDTSQAP